MKNHNKNLGSMEKHPGKSLRKRFFSKSGAPMATVPPPMPKNVTSGERTGTSIKEKLQLMMLPNGQIDMGMVLQAIEQR
jgi:hypothetical protein